MEMLAGRGQIMRYSDFIKENYNTVLEIIDCMKTGVWITDGKGIVVIVNQQSVQRGGLKRDEVIGRNMTELIDIGYILNESSALKAIESRQEESIVEEMGEGGSLLAVSVPLFYKNEIDLVICIEKNITDITTLEKALTEQKKLTKKLQTELELVKEGKVSNTGDMVACSISMIQLRERAINIGGIDATVMITGESGSGKEVVANLIHKSSRRANGPFIKINCAAIPETLLESEFFGYEKGAFTGANNNGKIGLFELANGGTLFLDEIGELSMAMQSKLLRVIQEKEIRRIGGEETIPVNVRFIAATNRDLKEETKNGTFRSDLYYRLMVVPIEVPPLRQRKEDIAQLAYRFLREFNEEYDINKTMSEDAIRAMERYSWPGNVRELRNIIERLAVGGPGNEITGFQIQMCLEGKENIGLTDMDWENTGLSLEEMVSEYEKQLIMQALEKNKNASEAAKVLKIDKSTMSKKRKKYNI